MTVLIDSNLLIGIAVDDHEHHELAAAWFVAQPGRFATCPVTEGALVRHVVRNRRTMTSAIGFLVALAERDEHEFWPDEISYAHVPTRGVIGHRQVTDAYLAEVARRRGARIATLDKGFAALHDDVVDLVPTS